VKIINVEGEYFVVVWLGDVFDIMVCYLLVL